MLESLLLVLGCAEGGDPAFDGVFGVAVELLLTGVPFSSIHARYAYISLCRVFAISICVRVIYSDMLLTRFFISFTLIRDGGSLGFVGFSRTLVGFSCFPWPVKDSTRDIGVPTSFGSSD